MPNETPAAAVDVLPTIRTIADDMRGDGLTYTAARLDAVHDAVADLIRLGDQVEQHDAEGKLTRWMMKQFRAALRRVKGESA